MFIDRDINNKVIGIFVVAQRKDQESLPSDHSDILEFKAAKLRRKTEKEIERTEMRALIDSIEDGSAKAGDLRKLVVFIARRYI